MGAEKKRTVDPAELEQLIVALLAYLAWIRLDPTQYDADAVARGIEALGIIDSEEWRPSSVLVALLSEIRGRSSAHLEAALANIPGAAVIMQLPPGLGMEARNAG